jgi:rubredoxin
MNNYILARWRDAITDPPPEGKPRLVKSHYGVIQHVLFERVGNRWTHADLELGDSEGWDGCDIEPGDQWLDVTAIPAVAREAVQAAVDLLESSVPSDCECPTCDAIRAMCRELGVAPYEVQ